MLWIEIIKLQFRGQAPHLFGSLPALAELENFTEKHCDHHDPENEWRKDRSSRERRVDVHATFLDQEPAPGHYNLERFIHPSLNKRQMEASEGREIKLYRSANLNILDCQHAV